jgi:hypothetical protein
VTAAGGYIPRWGRRHYSGHAAVVRPLARGAPWTPTTTSVSRCSLRSGLLPTDRLLGALAAWAAEPATPLPDLLVARGRLDPADRDAHRFNPKGDFGPLFDRADFQTLLKRLRDLPAAKKGKDKKDDGDK